jgi:hypothetical protein
MALDLDKMSKKLDEALSNMTQEEIGKYFPLNHQSCRQ